MALTNDLRHRLTVYNKHQIENDIGETCWQYTEDGKIWGALTVMVRQERNPAGRYGSRRGYA